MCPSTLAVAIFLLFLASLYSFFRQLKHIKHAQNFPPGPRPLPIIGNLHILATAKKFPHRILSDLAKTYGPLMLIRLGSVPCIVVSSPETAQLVLKTHDTVFASRPRVQAAELISNGKGVTFSEYGPYWRKARKLCTLQLLSTSKVELFGPMRMMEVRRMVESLKEEATENKVVDVSEKVGEVGEKMTFRMVLGREKDDRFDLKGIINEVMALAGAINVADFVPVLAPLDLQGLRGRVKAVSKSIEEALDKIIEEHQEDKRVKQKEEMDFVDVMLSLLNQDDEQSYRMDKANMKAILLDMIAGSFDTSKTIIEWCLSELLRHPETMLRLQKELENVVGKKNMVEETDLSKLTYLDMVIKESFRLHPVGALLLHESMEDILINGHYIPKKSRVMINVWAIGRDPLVWSNNAHEFIPERFAGNDRVDLRGHDFRLLPFGSGRRGCPGMQLGLINVRFIIAQLVHCFDWKLPDEMLPKDLDMSEQMNLVLQRANHLFAKPTYRLLC